MRRGERKEGPLMRRGIGMLAIALAVGGAAMAQTAITLSCGSPAPGNFAGNGTFDIYGIQAQPGDSILVRLLITSTDPTFVPKMILLDGSNHQITGTAGIGVGSNLVQSYTLTNGGTYGLEIQNSSSTPNAAYKVVFTYLNRACTGSLACGTGTRGALAAFELKSYQFAVNAGDVVSTRWTRVGTYTPVTVGTQQISFAPLVAVYSPTGALVAATSAATGGYVVSSPTAGLLTVLVLEPNNLTGNFVLLMVTTNRPCSGNTLSCGGVTQGSVTAALNAQTYGISMNAGDLGVVRTAAAPGSALGPVLELYDPTGTLLNAAASVPFRAQTAGVYTVVIRDGPASTVGTRTGTFVASLLFFNRPCASQTALSCPYVVDGNISGVLATSAYILNAQANDVFLMRLTGGGGSSRFVPQVQIFDKNGSQLATLSPPAGGNMARQTLTIPAAGAYTVFVTDGYDGTQSGSFTLSMLPLNRPCNPTGLSCGAVASGALARTLDAGVYSYTAAAGESFSVRMFDSTGALQPDLEVFDSSGNPVGQNISANYTGVDVVRPAAGTYTVIAMDSSTRPVGGPFTLDLLRTVNACAAPAAQGQTVSGVITAGTPFVSYSLPAAAGDALLVRSASTTPGFAAQMELYDATGARVDSQTYALSRKASAAGNVTVIVGASAPKTGGGYALSWQTLNNPAATTPLQCGGAVNGPMAGANQFQWYSAAASAGDVLRLLVTKTSDSFAPQMDVYDPTGARLASALDVTAAAKVDGGYLVAVGPSSSSAENGTYSLVFQRPNNPCSAAQLTCGQTALRKVTTPAQLDTFTFSGTGGDRADIKLTQRSGGYTPFGELYDASGKLLTASAGGTLLANLAASGTYTLLVRDTRGTTLGSYRVAVQDDTSACAVTDTQAPTVTLGAPTGGEAIGGGTTYQIQWQSDDNVGVTAHAIALSTDGGQTFPTTIASGLGGNQQSYTWQVPPDVAPTRTAVIRVTATDAAGNSGSAASGAVTLIGAGFTPNSTAAFGYDGLNRLVQATLSDGRTITYTYDAAGNLVAVTVGH
jgi:YD repeat-containing protein